jgi:hypothetical protein
MMHHAQLAALSPADEALFGIFLFVVFLCLIAVCLYNLWLSQQNASLSPYTQRPLRSGSELSYYAAEKVLRYLFYLRQYDNRIFELRRAGVCRETGRIFPEALTWYGVIRVDWGFLQKRYPGNYVSWGSLTQDQQESIIASHESLEGFQTENSSPQPQPKAIEMRYAYLKPGPLYVDIDTKVLLGWKSVPGTDLEVMIVQKPIPYRLYT